MRISCFASKSTHHYKSVQTTKSLTNSCLFRYCRKSDFQHAFIFAQKSKKRIWGGIEPIPKGLNKSKPLRLKPFFPKGKSCFSSAGTKPLMSAARPAFTRCTFTASSNPLHQTAIFFPIHLLFTFTSWKSFKDFHKYLDINAHALIFQRFLLFLRGVVERRN